MPDNNSSSKLELVCVGNYKGKPTDTQCRVTAITEAIDHTTKSVTLYQKIIFVRSFYTVGKIHYCIFDIPDNVVCFYRRRVQTVPGVNEGRFFKMLNGIYTELGIGTEPFDYIYCFMRDYIERLHYKVGMLPTATNWNREL